MYLDTTSFFIFLMDNLFCQLKNLLPSGERDTDFILFAFYQFSVSEPFVLRWEEGLNKGYLFFFP